MSEYQYYEFLAIDRPLDADELELVRSTSKRASITPVSFINEYHWGGYHGDPHVLMQRFYDAHLYVANWSTRRFMLRLPTSLLTAEAEEYCTDETLSLVRNDTSVILDFWSDTDDCDEDFADPRGILSTLIGVRSELAAGDLRPLYIAWLAALADWMLDDECESDSTAPPVPAGLNSLTAAQEALADFLRVDPTILAAAASASGPLGSTTDDPDDLADWIALQPSVDKDRLLFRVIAGEGAAVRAEMISSFRDDQSPRSEIGDTLAVRELLTSAGQIEAEIQRKREAEVRAEQSRRQQKEQRARTLRLNAISSNKPAAWERVSCHISHTQAAEYDAAVRILLDLRALAERDGDLDEFEPHVADLRCLHKRKTTFLARLDKAGL